MNPLSTVQQLRNAEDLAAVRLELLNHQKRILADLMALYSEGDYPTLHDKLAEYAKTQKSYLATQQGEVQ